MRQVLVVVLAAMLLASLSSIALARGAPEKQKAFAVEQVMTVDVAPMVASVPPMTVGYDVILNISEKQTTHTAVTTERRRQSTTRAVQSGATRSHNRAAPAFVLLA